MVAHVCTSCRWSVICERSLYIAILLGGFEQHNIRIMIACNVETMLIWSTYQFVVSIYKLHESSGCHAQTYIACRRHSLVVLSKIDDIVGKVGDIVECCELRTIVDDDNLALLLAER